MNSGFVQTNWTEFFSKIVFFSHYFTKYLASASTNLYRRYPTNLLVMGYNYH